MLNPVNDGRRSMSGIRKWAIHLLGHKTSLSLDDEFWDALQEISAAKGERLPDTIKATIKAGRTASIQVQQSGCSCCATSKP
jgi:predicted DNA-binding ribbon-helix-helix protein